MLSHKSAPVVLLPLIKLRREKFRLSLKDSEAFTSFIRFKTGRLSIKPRASFHSEETRGIPGRFNDTPSPLVQGEISIIMEILGGFAGELHPHLSDFDEEKYSGGGILLVS